MKTFNLRNFVFTAFLIIGLLSCTDDFIAEVDEVTPKVETRAIVAPEFDWETIDAMPTPANQYISIPWTGQGALAIEQSLLFDFKRVDGWEMLYHTFFTDKGTLSNPYFILYNKFRGLMRVYLYVNTQFVTTSQNIQDYMVVTANSSILNYLPSIIVDTKAPNVLRYEQVQDKKISTNKWYMMEYELAYDPNISNYSYNQISLQWGAKYHDIQSYNFYGTTTGNRLGGEWNFLQSFCCRKSCFCWNRFRINT